MPASQYTGGPQDLPGGYDGSAGTIGGYPFTTQIEDERDRKLNIKLQNGCANAWCHWSHDEFLPWLLRPPILLPHHPQLRSSTKSTIHCCGDAVWVLYVLVTCWVSFLFFTAGRRVSDVRRSVRPPWFDVRSTFFWDEIEMVFVFCGRDRMELNFKLGWWKSPHPEKIFFNLFSLLSGKSKDTSTSKRILF